MYICANTAANISSGRGGTWDSLQLMKYSEKLITGVIRGVEKFTGCAEEFLLFADSSS